MSFDYLNVETIGKYIFFSNQEKITRASNELHEFLQDISPAIGKVEISKTFFFEKMQKFTY